MKLALNHQRALAASAILASVDRQGRVNVDEKLRTYAGLQLDSQIVVAGNLTRLELWSPDRYARIEAEGTDDIAGAVPRVLMLTARDSLDDRVTAQLSTFATGAKVPRAGSKPGLRTVTSSSSPTTRSIGFTSCNEPPLLPLPRGVRRASYTNAWACEVCAIGGLPNCSGGGAVLRL